MRALSACCALACACSALAGWSFANEMWVAWVMALAGIVTWSRAAHARMRLLVVQTRTAELRRINEEFQLARMREEGQA